MLNWHKVSAKDCVSDFTCTNSLNNYYRPVR